MFETKNLPNAYVEVLEILKYIPNEDYNKIPEYIIKGFNENKSASYSYDIQNYNQNIMMYETSVILAILFRDYWATEEQKKKIKAKEAYDLKMIEIEKSKKYNVNDIFKNTKVSSSSDEGLNDNVLKKDSLEEDNTSIVEYKESFFKRLINKIKSFLNK